MTQDYNGEDSKTYYIRYALVCQFEMSKLIQVGHVPSITQVKSLCKAATQLPKFVEKY